MNVLKYGKTMDKKSKKKLNVSESGFEATPISLHYERALSIALSLIHMEINISFVNLWVSLSRLPNMAIPFVTRKM